MARYLYGKVRTACQPCQAVTAGSLGESSLPGNLPGGWFSRLARSSFASVRSQHRSWSPHWPDASAPHHSLLGEAVRAGGLQRSCSMWRAVHHEGTSLCEQPGLTLCLVLALCVFVAGLRSGSNVEASPRSTRRLRHEIMTAKSLEERQALGQGQVGRADEEGDGLSNDQ